MRDIKFRGICKTGKRKGQFVHGSLVKTNNFIKRMARLHSKYWIVESSFGNGGWFSILKREWVIDESVGQFIGLKDVNGVEIYEGSEVDGMLVSWCDNHLSYVLINISSGDIVCLADYARCKNGQIKVTKEHAKL